MPALFLLFTAVPLLDLWLLIRIGDAVGVGPALALVIVTGVLGAALARAEGTRVLGAWRRALEAGRMPEEGILSGVLVLAGGLLLVTPGVITDAAGFLLLIPPTRRLATRALRRWLDRKVASGSVRVVRWGGGARPTREPIDVTPRRPGDDA